MKIHIQNTNADQLTLSITAPWEMLSVDYDKLLKHYATFPIKGFRKAPLKVVETTFKKQLETDLANNCTSRLCRIALQKEQITAGSPISITAWEMNAGTDFSFTATFLKMPEFDLPDYFDLQLTAMEAEDKSTEISQKLLERTTINLPEAFIDEEMKYSEEELPAANGRKAAAERVKLLLILKKIAVQDVIEVSDELLEERIADIAAENETGIEEVKAFLSSNGGLSRLNDYLLAEQVLLYISENQK